MERLRRETPATQTDSLDERVGWLERRFYRRGQYEIKLWADDDTIAVDARRFVFSIPTDLDKTKLLDAQAFVTTTGTGATILELENETQAVAMLTDPIQIDSGELDSRTSSAPSEPDPATWKVNARDQIAIEISSAGSGAMGLGVMLLFG
jgi:hypothetical protein